MPAVEEVKLGSVDSVEKENQPKHIPSTVQADTLFTFTNHIVLLFLFFSTYKSISQIFILKQVTVHRYVNCN